MLVNEGDVLHFAYDVIAPNHAADELYRTDELVDQPQFKFDPSTGFFGVEDLRLPFSDADYNDATFRVSFASTVPGPGALVAFALALLAVPMRRKPMRG